jgi:hypothetical protein
MISTPFRLIRMLGLCGVHSSSHASCPMQVSSVDNTKSPIRTCCSPWSFAMALGRSNCSPVGRFHGVNQRVSLY